MRTYPSCREILGVLLSQAGELRLGLVGLPGTAIVISQDANSPRILRKIVGSLAKHLLGPGLVALFEDDLGKALPGGEAFLIGGNSVPAHLLGILEAFVPGIECGQQELGVHRPWIEDDRLLQFRFHRILLGGVAGLQQCEGLVQGGLAGSQFQGALNLSQGDILLSLPGGDAGQQGVSIGVVWLGSQSGVSLRLGFVDLASGKEDVSQIDARLIVGGLKFHGAAEFGESWGQSSHVEESLGQAIMRLGEVLVDFQRVGVLNGSFLVFALGAVLLSTFQVFLLSHVWIAMAAGDESEGEKERNRRKGRAAIAQLPPVTAV